MNQRSHFLRGETPNTVGFQAVTGEDSGFIHIPPVEDHGLFQRRPDRLEVGRAEAFPFRHHHQSVGAIERVILAFA